MIIGLTGFAGSGKNTAGLILHQEFGFQQVSYADILKDSVSALFGWDRHLLEGDTQESREWRETEDPFWTQHLNLGRPITPRFILQYMGTEIIRQTLHDDFWILALENRLIKGSKYVITDVRFPNELKSITEKLNGRIFRIERGELPVWYHAAKTTNTKGTDDMAKKYPWVHKSEWSIIGVDKFNQYKIDNNGSIEDLRQNIIDTMEQIQNETN